MPANGRSALQTLYLPLPPAGCKFGKEQNRKEWSYLLFYLIMQTGLTFYKHSNKLVQKRYGLRMAAKMLFFMPVTN